jgi:SPP1 gp7 family putative phage head morphogenesis protein
MNATCDFDDALLGLHEAGTFLDVLLGECCLSPVTKALDLGTPTGFDRAVALLGARLRKSSWRSDAHAMRDCLEVLDVDWHQTTAAQRRRLVQQSLVAAGRAVSGVERAIQAPFSEAAQTVVSATRTDARRKQGLAIAADSNALDQRVVTHVVRSQSNFVRDEYGRRLDDFGAEARKVVAAGLEQGLGRDDIAEEIRHAAESVFINRSRSYWDVVASAFIGQGRAFAQMSSYAEAGVERYVIEAVLDEVTTPACRFLHGKTFTVAQALARFEQVERLENPEDIKTVMPWVRHGIDNESRRSVLFVNGTDGRVPLAEVLRSGTGRRDDRGDFRAIVGDDKLGELGIGFPPYHGHCRTTTLAT